MVNITIDGHQIEAKEGSTVLQNAQALKIDIPTLCFHKEVSPFGACRLCSVEIKANGKWQLAASCQTEVAKGMEVKTDTTKVRENRKLAAALLYYKYPTTEAVRTMAAKLGVEIKGEKTDGRDCILCGLCTRTCHEIVRVDALRFQDRGLGREVEPKIEFVTANCIGCGSCAYACPTGFVQMESVDDKRIIWNKVFKMATCKVCGQYFAPIEQLEWIAKTTGQALDNLMTCTSCR
ncbi:MAG: 2Fe-2S iron-sulfur cluster-binding protein [Syntrophales bacterium]|nr:2Fe-2S iron-sulfur cluster-binding protein [Syntrophales bacterium]